MSLDVSFSCYTCLKQSPRLSIKNAEKHLTITNTLNIPDYSKTIHCFGSSHSRLNKSQLWLFMQFGRRECNNINKYMNDYISAQFNTCLFYHIPFQLLIIHSSVDTLVFTYSCDEKHYLLYILSFIIIIYNTFFSRQKIFAHIVVLRNPIYSIFLC